MSRNSICRAVAAAVLGWGVAVPGWGQETPLLRPMDSQGAAALERLSEQQLAELDAQLREALLLYYQRAYRLALPIFQEIAAQAETLDVLYWLGSSAFHADRPDVAIDKFQTMLRRNPELHQVRVDLAMAYLKTGDEEAAREHLDQVLASDGAPAGLKQVVRRLSGSDKPWRLRLRAAVGRGYDSNVFSQPGRDPGEPGQGGVKEGDAYTFLDLNVDHIYDVGSRGEWYWRTRLRLHQDLFDDEDADYRVVDLRTGAERHGENYRLRLSAGIKTRNYQDDELSDSLYLNPEFEWLGSGSGPDWRVGYVLEQEDFVAARDAQDATIQRLSVGPVWRLAEGEDSLQLRAQAQLGRRDADADFHSYDEAGVSASALGRWRQDWEGFLGAGYLNRDYDGNVLNRADREDDRYYLTAALSRQLGERFFATVNMTRIVNDSNDRQFDYGKTVVGVSVGTDLTW